MTDRTNWAKVLGELAADCELSCNRQIAATKNELAAEMARMRERFDGHDNNVVPPELAEQVKAAIHLLHESPPIVQLNAPPRSASPLPPPRPSRIERTENGGYTLIYDEQQA